MSDEEETYEEETYEERLAEEGYAIASTTITSYWADGTTDGRERRFLEESIRMQEEILENNGKAKLPGYISNEIYEPINKTETIVKKEKVVDRESNIMNISLNEIMEKTSQRLNDFDSDFLRMLYRVDLKYGYTDDEKGVMKNITRYFTAFVFYLNDKNNILYVGITMLIISIILYFINIIRK
jgi:hypothetical protein